MRSRSAHRAQNRLECQIGTKIYALSPCPYSIGHRTKILPLTKGSAGQFATAAAATAAGKDFAPRYDIQVFPAYIFATEFTRSLRFWRVLHTVAKKWQLFVYLVHLHYYLLVGALPSTGSAGSVCARLDSGCRR